MMNKKTSYKRIVSLVLAVVMVAAMLTVSAAENTMIYVNDELAVNNTEYTGAVTVTVKGEFASVTVNGDKVDYDENGSFVIDPNGVETADEPATQDEPATTDEPAAPATQDEAATDDTATNDTAKEPGLAGKETPVVKAAGKVDIAVYDQAGAVLSAVTIYIEKTATTDEPSTDDTATDDTATDDTATDDTATDDTATDDTATDDTATDDTATDDTATDDTATDDTATDDTATDDTATDDTATDDTATDDTATDDQATDDQAETVKVLNGDVNGDGQITSADALLILRYSIDLEKDFTKVQKAQADVTGNGVYSDDALIVLRASADLEKINPEYIDVVL